MWVQVPSGLLETCATLSSTSLNKRRKTLQAWLSHPLPPQIAWKVQFIHSDQVHVWSFPAHIIIPLKCMTDCNEPQSEALHQESQHCCSSLTPLFLHKAHTCSITSPLFTDMSCVFVFISCRNLNLIREKEARLYRRDRSPEAHSRETVLF